MSDQTLRLKRHDLIRDEQPRRASADDLYRMRKVVELLREKTSPGGSLPKGEEKLYPDLPNSKQKINVPSSDGDQKVSPNFSDSKKLAANFPDIALAEKPRK